MQDFTCRPPYRRGDVRPLEPVLGICRNSGADLGSALILLLGTLSDYQCNTNRKEQASPTSLSLASPSFQGPKAKAWGIGLAGQAWQKFQLRAREKCTSFLLSRLYILQQVHSLSSTNASLTHPHISLYSYTIALSFFFGNWLPIYHLSKSHIS